MKNIPEDKKKELKITKADEEYFSGAKKNLFGKKSFKVSSFDVKISIICQVNMRQRNQN